MLFTDSLFIFGLILLFFVYFLIPRKYRWMLLLAASIAFYAYSGWTNLFYIAATALSTFFITKHMEKMAGAAKEAVGCIYDKQKGKIVLFYTGPAEKAALASYLKQRLPRYMQPNRIRQIDKMPHTPNGKLDRKALTAMYEQEA